MSTRNVRNDNFFTKFKSVTSWLFLVTTLMFITYISFLENIRFDLLVRNAAAFTLITSTLSIVIWNMFYSNYFDKVLDKDYSKGKHSVHMKFYYSRQGFTEDVLRARIDKYNKDARQSWYEDVKSITGRTIEQIKRGKYRKNNHKLLIWRVKRNLVPKTGIKYPKQLLNILSVNYSNGYSYKLNRYKTLYARKLITKIVTTVFIIWFGASIGADFITGKYIVALIKLAVGILSVLGSVFGGLITGIRSAKLKLASGEDITRLFMAWKQEPDIKSKLVKTNSDEEYDKFVNSNTESEPITDYGPVPDYLDIDVT